ncbi:MAG: hypothetical protein KDA85_12405, partial [Planctomycetaceae bacterium]|nr:hypothetical protein [Planctomycetaceae bacterium]
VKGSALVSLEIVLLFGKLFRPFLPGQTSSPAIFRPRQQFRPTGDIKIHAGGIIHFQTVAPVKVIVEGG